MVAAGAWATGIAVAGAYEVPIPGTVPTTGPLVDPTVPGGTVWFCLTLSSNPISAIAGRHKFVKWYLASTFFWSTPSLDRQSSWNWSRLQLLSGSRPGLTALLGSRPPTRLAAASDSRGRTRACT